MKHWQRWLMAGLAAAALAMALTLGSSGGESAQAQSVTIYVDVDAAGVSNGTSWEDAYTTLQPALEDASSGDEIWVAAGTYTPTYQYVVTDTRSATFQMKNGVALYGGFDPSVGDVGWEDRDWVNNVAILSGDIGNQGDPVDNSYHVFYHPPELALNSTAILDGFTVTGGSANGDWPDYFGGGMYNEESSPTVVDCTFSDNSAMGHGGGMWNAYSSPTVVNCTFSGNSAFGGGGMLNNSSAPVVTNCTFLGNSTGWGGGGILNHGSSPTVTNCTFSGNYAPQGGGMYNTYSSSPTVTDCTFSGNSAYSGGGIYNIFSSPAAVTNCTFSGNSAYDRGGAMANISSSPAVTNCVLWEDTPDEVSNEDGSEPSVTYSDIQGGYDGAGNIDADPLFVDSGSGDYHLGPGSPCIDAGTNDAPSLPDFDFEGDPRIMDGNRDGMATVDMGIDEVYGYARYLSLVFRGY